MHECSLVFIHSHRHNDLLLSTEHHLVLTFHLQTVWSVNHTGPYGDVEPAQWTLIAIRHGVLAVCDFQFESSQTRFKQPVETTQQWTMQ